MDTTTKMFFIATKDDVYLKFLSVLIDVQLKNVTSNTIERAKQIRTEFSDLFEENNWLKMVAGTNVENLDNEWIVEINREVEEEFLSK